ncbi:similar to Saccharomyces cerevisiae YPL093W NOG1 Putative GTPase that associates with free 60S ribosomal subunits in the nucleolus and is required for 60S ribosomal subunit biogenesis [Maudiozyma barnettii]|uniref:Nucleolar GTP-binding protein 1 n=1 Tax=Maudiozyma barnettii TaxID=61262 RepID=A0A8H2VDQ4_9SACH|nr:putative GTPase NOG1 [Kazachstania barnettii]CAB4253670.1 similar to Saccharomyces cerevisiae YPL093W NOG1 Putative GTPase that associates with free 60S ribosomal subunits in the nucleolus and is required for 60S ribosomal subunit biogenesis [Kazachstania barnettii]CAD1781374.1 similar to Saccharomyces cerevisiae YPL093W NOG1 Putative GTPase that associates with free 60S ribosomal subunits in the nucleolus and is required for 60S ribosomal subunit biogenesis [Kazachstania barnettii]
MQLSWKDIPTVPPANDLLDIVLNRTQRKTPTVIRPGFNITRIRAFYMRKVRFTGEGFVEKFDDLLKGFPNINDVHPFHRDLMDTLYEKNHYKISLAAISRAKSLVEQVARDYVRLLKFGQSLFQCKQLKRAALGRMATIVKKLKDPLNYLEQVRQHLGRLPSIDPNTRTLLICGYPNVGKSSFLRCITKADVEVQPYAFTTKSLYVGHFDYKYLRFQAIDTPGILDRPTEEMNNIEMQSIYAIAHLRSCVLYFMDLSEQCGFTIEAQVKLFHSIKPLFANKSVMVVINKTDIIAPEDLDEERSQLLQTIRDTPGVEVMATSCQLEENVMDVRNQACEKLLASRIENKLKSQARINNVLNKIHVSQPQARDDVKREPYIPDQFKQLRKYDAEDPERRMLARDIEAENGGAGVFNVNLKDKYLLDDDEWKNDVMPEILDGKNVYDFLDPEIASKLQALEEEEEKLESEGFYNSDDEENFDGFEGEELDDIREKADWIRDRQKRMIKEARNRKSLKNKAIMPRSKLSKSFGDMEKHMSTLGHDLSTLQDKQRVQAGKNRFVESGADVVFGGSEAASATNANGGKLKQSDRLLDGVADGFQRSKAERMAKLQRRERNRNARAGEADRHETASLPKHLFSGKRGNGKTDFR